MTGACPTRRVGAPIASNPFALEAAAEAIPATSALGAAFAYAVKAGIQGLPQVFPAGCRVNAAELH